MAVRFVLVLAALSGLASPALGQSEVPATAQAAAGPTAPSVQYGVGLRMPRWVTVPGS